MPSDSPNPWGTYPQLYGCQNKYALHRRRPMTGWVTHVIFWNEKINQLCESFEINCANLLLFPVFFIGLFFWVFLVFLAPPLFLEPFSLFFLSFFVEVNDSFSKFLVKNELDSDMLVSLPLFSNAFLLVPL